MLDNSDGNTEIKDIDDKEENIRILDKRIKEFYKAENHKYAIEYLEKFIKSAKVQIGKYDPSVFEGASYIIEDTINKINTTWHSHFAFKYLYLNKVLDYVGFVMERYPNAITEFGFISHLYQFAQKEQEDKELADKLKQFFDKRIHKEDADIKRFEPYREKLDNFTKMSQDEFKSFLNVAIDYRNKTGMFPENVCDYIIKQLLISKLAFNLGLTNFIKMRVMEDKAGYLAKEKGYNNTITVSSEVSDQFFRNNSVEATYYQNGLIRLRASNCWDWFEIEKNGITGRQSIKILNSLFHEIRHMIQPEQRKQYYYNPIRYKMFKEKILCEFLPGYNDENYTPNFIESDARIYADIDIIQYLKKLKFTKEELREAGLSNFEEIAESNVLAELSDEESADTKYDPELKKERNFEDIFQDLLKRSHWIIYENPLLEFEYDYDTGERKGNMELLKKYQDSMLSEKIYPTIIRNGATVSNEKILEDIEKIVSFTPEYPETEKLRDYILCEKILPRVKEWIQKGKIDFKPIDGLSKKVMDRIEKIEFKFAINSLIQFAKSHPNFSKDMEFLTMLKSDGGIRFSADEFLKGYRGTIEAAKEGASITEAAGVLNSITKEKETEKVPDGKEEETDG